MSTLQVNSGTKQKERPKAVFLPRWLRLGERPRPSNRGDSWCFGILLMMGAPRFYGVPL
jgi:hypothetical protein